MVHHGNIDGFGLGTLDAPTSQTERPSALTIDQVRMQILNSLPTVPEGTPVPLGDGTSASIIALALYGERSPCLQGDMHPAMYQNCA